MSPELWCSEVFEFLIRVLVRGCGNANGCDALFDHPIEYMSSTQPGLKSTAGGTDGYAHLFDL